MLRDPAEAPAIEKCAWCGGEVYVGDEVRRSYSGEIVHDGSCAKRLAYAQFYESHGVIGADLTIN